MTWKIPVVVTTMLVTLATVLLAPGDASALSTFNGTASNEWFYIGSFNHDGSTKMWICKETNNLNDSSATWQPLGTSSLTDDWEVHGQGGADYMIVIRSNSTVSNGECSGTWGALSYGTSYMDLFGDAGNDTLLGGAGDTYTDGGADADTLYQYSGTGRTYGASGNDSLIGLAGSNDYLSGESDNDCLLDFNNSWLLYDCGSTGTDSDTYYYTNTGTKYDCESSTIYCCAGVC